MGRLPSAALRRLGLMAALSLLLAAPAAGFVGPEERRGDLDGDGDLESVRAERVDIPGVEDQFDQTAIHVRDNCPDGREVDRRVSGRQDNLALLRLRRADTRPGREVFFDLRSGAAGRGGEARLVAWRARSGYPCRVARRLFRYRNSRPTRRPRRSDGDVATFLIRLRNASRRFRGLEIVLDERFQRPGEPSCCGSIKKVTYWRYSRRLDRYLRYRTKLRYRKPFPGARR
jgi:hypothetical protein